MQARQRSAIATVKSLIKMFGEEEAVNAMLERHITKQDSILAKYEKLDQNNQKLDTNNQRIDILGQETSAIWRGQHEEDRNTIASLQKDINSCRSNQKWIFAGGTLAGGAIAWKIKGNNGIVQNPFASFTQTAPPAFMTMTSTEENLRRALKALNH